MQMIREIGGWIAPTAVGSIWGVLQVLVAFGDEGQDPQGPMRLARDVRSGEDRW